MKKCNNPTKLVGTYVMNDAQCMICGNLNENCINYKVNQGKARDVKACFDCCQTLRYCTDCFCKHPNEVAKSSRKKK